MKITGRTKIVGIIGYPVEHTLSPPMHNAAFESLGLDYCYVPFLVHPDELETAVRSVRALHLCGVNVTVPYKERVMPLLDEINEEAAFIGAANTIVNSGGRLAGHNTDGRGFMRSLSESGVIVEDKNIAIIGAGGAARAIGYYLCQKAGTLSIYGRTIERAEKLVQDLNKIKKSVHTLQDLSSIGTFQIIINATPVGLKKDDQLLIDIALLRPEQTVCDLIYRDTALLIESSKKGCAVLNGFGMLLWQGVYAFELFTGEKPPVEVMRNALLKSGK
jgi:shikimate dehydrogenase